MYIYISTAHIKYSTVRKKLSQLNKKYSTLNEKDSTLRKKDSQLNKKDSSLNKNDSTLRKKYSSLNKRAGVCLPKQMDGATIGAIMQTGIIMLVRQDPLAVRILLLQILQVIGTEEDLKDLLNNEGAFRSS